MAGFNSSGGLVNVGISMTLQDHFTGPAGNILSSWNSMMQNMNTFQRGLKSAYEDSINQTWGLLREIGNLAAYSTEIENNTFMTSKIIDGTLGHQESMLKLAKEINLRNPLRLADITSGQKFMAMAGMTAQQIENATEPAAQLAAVFDMDMGGKGGTADLMTNVMATFNKEAGQASEVANILSVATTSANMSLQDLAQSIKYSGSSARNVGMDINELAAFIGVLGNRGIQGSMAGTNFSQAINQLVKGMNKNPDILKSIGLTPADLKDSEGNLLSMYEVFSKIAAATKDLNTADRQNTMFNLFGMRGMRAAVPILDDINSGANQYLKILQEINNQPDWLSSTITEKMEGPGWIDQMTSAFDNLKETLGTTFKEVIRPLAQNVLIPIIKGVTWIAGTGMGKWAAGAFLILTSFKLIRVLLGFSATFIRGMSTGLITASSSSRSLSIGLGTSRNNAASLAIYLERCAMTMNRMAYMQMVQAGVIGPRGYMPIGGGYAYRVDARGQGYYVNQATRQRVPANQAMGLTPLGMGGGWTRNQYVGPTTKMGRMRDTMSSPLFVGMRNKLGATGNSAYARTMTRGVFGMTRGIGAIGSVLGRTLGFLGGPWGMGISLALTFVPQIFSWLKGSKDKEPTPEELQAREDARVAEIQKALREGKSATININLNGQNLGTFSNGDTVNAPMPGGYQGFDDYGLEYN
ncbi:MAG: phage tail tape measure protein [Roseburia sp.]|nr:phage tail tape measure protein [Roseburia sp.]